MSNTIYYRVKRQLFVAENDDQENIRPLANCKSSFLPPKYYKEKQPRGLKRCETKPDLDYMDQKLNQDYLKNQHYISKYRSKLRNHSKNLSCKLKKKK